MGSKEVRDPIYGLIELEPEEWQVIGSVPFQRLRGVQQLAMTHLVYPGARHSRWEHCVGAAHLAGRVGRSVGFEEVRRKKVRLAALAHDLGHGPFSHVSEEIFEARTERRAVHETISAAIVRHDQTIRAAMGEETADWVADLLNSKNLGKKRSIERDIVAGPADVDKLDYLLRDSHFCGVKYGEYDLDKVVESARFVVDSFEVESFLAFDISGIYALEEMLLARYHMHRQVYGHRTRVATDRMLVRAMELAIDDGLLPNDVFTPPEDPGPEFVKEYVRWDDARVIRTLVGSEGSMAGEVMRALVERRLFKRILEYDFPRLGQEFGQPEAGYIAQPNEKVLREHLSEAEAIVARALGVDQHWVSLHWMHVANPISERFSFKVEGQRILIVDGDSRHEFNEKSEVFSETELPAQIRIGLYARLRDDAESLGKDASEDLEDAFQEALQVVGRASAES